jgi:hypothetical protein
MASNCSLDPTQTPLTIANCWKTSRKLGLLSPPPRKPMTEIRPSILTAFKDCDIVAPTSMMLSTPTSSGVEALAF